MTASQILVVDDDPELRRFLAGELVVEGHRVDTAATGQEALCKIRDCPPDLVLLDSAGRCRISVDWRCAGGCEAVV